MLYKKCLQSVHKVFAKQYLGHFAKGSIVICYQEYITKKQCPTPFTSNGLCPFKVDGPPHGRNLCNWYWKKLKNKKVHSRWMDFFVLSHRIWLFYNISYIKSKLSLILEPPPHNNSHPHNFPEYNTTVTSFPQSHYYVCMTL